MLRKIFGETEDPCDHNYEEKDFETTDPEIHIDDDGNPYMSIFYGTVRRCTECNALGGIIEHDVKKAYLEVSHIEDE